MVVNVRSGGCLEIPPTQRTGRPVAVSSTEVQCHMSVSLIHECPRWNAEFVCARLPTRGPSIVPSYAGAYGGSFTGAVCTAPVTLLA